MCFRGKRAGAKRGKELGSGSTGGFLPPPSPRPSTVRARRWRRREGRQEFRHKNAYELSGRRQPPRGGVDGEVTDRLESRELQSFLGMGIYPGS